MSCRKHDEASTAELEKYNRYPKQGGKNHMKEFLDGFKEEDTTHECGHCPRPDDPELQGVPKPKV